MTTTQRLGFDIVATDKTGAAFASVKRFTDEVLGVQKQINGFAGPMSRAEGSVRQFGYRLQNVSLQIGDFAVQVGSGTDATRALSQQLPQLLGGLGTIGAVAGAAVAIILPLTQALAKTRDYAKEVADGLNKLDEAQKISSASIVDLTEQYGRYAGVMSMVAQTQEELAKSEISRALMDQAKAVVDLNSAYIGTAGVFGEIANQWRNADFGRSAIAQAFAPLDEVANKVNFLKDKFGLTEKAARGVMVPFRDFQLALQNTNTEAAALALEQFNRWINKNRQDAASAIPIFDQMQTQFKALSKVFPAAKGSMGFSFTPVTPATGFNNFESDSKVAEQLAAIEKRLTDAKEAAARASQMAAEAQRRETSAFQQFVATVDRGATPMQQLQNTVDHARESFGRFGDKLNTDQLKSYNDYIAGLNKRIEELTFKERWDNMAVGIQTATSAMTPLRAMIDDLGQGVEDSFVNGISDAFMAFVDGSDSAQDALRNFAATFTREMSAMIAKALILFAVQKLIGLASGSTAYGSLMQGFGGVYGNGLLSNANGNVFSGGRVVPFANGGIVSSPTLFRMGSGGLGLMGEAGSEAIVPLARRNGKLGVGASPVNVSINNYSGADVRTRQRSDGGIDIDVLEKQLAGRMIRGGSPLSQSLESRYGLRRGGR